MSNTTQKEWQLKQLLPLTTELEKKMLEIFNSKLELVRKYGKHSRRVASHMLLTEEVVKSVLLNGFFLSTISGPGGYHAFGVHNSPYDGPLFVMEYDPDLLQPGDSEFELGEEVFINFNSEPDTIEKKKFNQERGCWEYAFYGKQDEWRSADELHTKAQVLGDAILMGMDFGAVSQDKSPIEVIKSIFDEEGKK